jgi:hypothetical protein
MYLVVIWSCVYSVAAVTLWSSAVFGCAVGLTPPGMLDLAVQRPANSVPLRQNACYRC